MIHSNSNNRQAGFTLLELVVVIVIIGILISIFTLSFSAYDDSTADEEMVRFETILNLSMEEASIQGRELGLLFYQHGYEFSMLSYAQDKDGKMLPIWTPLDSDRLLRPRKVGEELRFEVELESKTIKLDFERTEQDPEDYEPQIFIYSSGDIEPPFDAVLRSVYGGSEIKLSVERDGSIEVVKEQF